MGAKLQHGQPCGNYYLDKCTRDELEKLIDPAEKHPVELTTEKITEAAQAATGLSEFGRNDFYQRLENYIDATTDYPEPTELGRLGKLIACYKFACARLDFHQFVKNHPDVYYEKIECPIIIVGPGRSGTTYLQRIIATDPRLNYLSHNGLTGLFSECSNTGFDPPLFELLKRCADSELHRTVASILETKASRAPNTPIEDIALLSLDFPVGLLELREPYSLGKYLEYDHTAHYEYMKLILQALQWLRGEKKRWILKDPAHSLQLTALMKVLPDAIIVATHRDPLAVTKSIATKFAPAVKLAYRNSNLAEMAKCCVKRTELMSKAILRGSHAVPEGQMVDLIFHEYTLDILSTIKRIYKCAQLEFTESDRLRIGKFTPGASDYNKNTHKFDMVNDFFLNPDDVRSQFSFYYEHYPVEIEAV